MNCLKVEDVDDQLLYCLFVLFLFISGAIRDNDLWMQKNSTDIFSVNVVNWMHEELMFQCDRKRICFIVQGGGAHLLPAPREQNQTWGTNIQLGYVSCQLASQLIITGTGH